MGLSVPNGGIYRIAFAASLSSEARLGSVVIADVQLEAAQSTNALPGAYIGNNELSVEDAERMLRHDEADLISFARAYIANPDLVDRIRTGAPLAEAPQEYWYGGDETGYSDWPAIHPVAAE